MAPSVQFPALELSIDRGSSAMNFGPRVMGLGLAVLITTGVALSPIAFAQNNLAQTIKRKVRNRIDPEMPLAFIELDFGNLN